MEKVRLIYDIPYINHGDIMKKCITCEQEKELVEFSLRRNKKHYVSECKLCSSKRSKEWYWKNRDKAIENRKKLYETTREESLRKCKERYQLKKEEIRFKANQRNRSPEQRAKSNARSKQWYQLNKEKAHERSSRWKRENKDKSLAHQYVLWALRLNVLQKPENCQSCSKNIKVEAHHKDYSKPLEIMWLCKICHEKIHHEECYDDACSVG